MKSAAEGDLAGFRPWQREGDAIPLPLGGLRGDASRGRAVVADRERGNCIACHRLAIPEEPMHGSVGPPLTGVGGRYSAGQLRLRVVTEKALNPATIMPGFHVDPTTYNRPRPDAVRPILSAQEVEDVVAYLSTLN
jgi:sulfur-oxidizing protein SoxX